MMYVVQVIAGDPEEAVRRTWIEQAYEMRAQHRLRSAELFERVEDIRDANYGYVGLSGFATDEDGETALEADASFGTKTGVEQFAFRNLVQIGQIAATGPDDVWLVNPFEVGAGEIEGALAMWDRAKGHMIAHDGFVNARLFRACEESARYGLLNLSQWRSAQQFKAALSNRAYDSHRDQSMNYRLHPSLCRRVFAFSDEHVGQAIT